MNVGRCCCPDVTDVKFGNVSTVGYAVVLFQVVSRRRQEQKSKVETKDKTDEAGNPARGRDRKGAK